MKMPLLETLLFTLSKSVDFFPVLTMLALLIDYLVECVCLTVCYTACTTTQSRIKSYLTWFSAANIKTHAS